MNTRPVLPASEPSEAVVGAIGALRLAWASGGQIHPLPDLDLNGAYEVQHGLVAEFLAEGRQLVGYKIGLTSVGARLSLGASTPDYGHLLDDMLVRGATVSMTRLRQPRAEVEIALKLGADLQGPVTEMGDAASAVAAVAPAIEIVDTRIADWEITLADTVADNGSAAMAVIGAWSPFPAASDLSAVEGTLRVDSEVVARGVGADVYGHPLRSLMWLANALASRGESLRVGQVVLTGSLVAPFGIGPSSTVVAELSGLGQVEVTLVESEE